MKELRAALLTRLAGLLEPGGYRQREQSFWREAGAARLAFHIAFLNHASDFDVTADVAVRHHAVEEMLELASTGKRGAPVTSTVGAELGNLAGAGQQRWNVSGAGNVEPVALAIHALHQKIGEPFLLRFHDAVETLRTLEENGREARLICPLPDRRARIRDALRKLLAPG